MARFIKIAETSKEIDDVFKIRHKVFVEEENRISPNIDRRLLDRYDTYPKNKNLIVFNKQKEVIGTMRMSIDSEVGVPADEYYDFRSHIDTKNNLIMHCGMFCVLEKYRDARITTGLLLMATYFAFANNVTHVVAPIHPAIAKLLLRIGFRQIDDIFVEEHTNLEMMPLVAELSNINDFFIHFAKRNKMEGFVHDYERWFFDEGETIIKTGEEGEEAFLIISGEAEVKLPHQESPIATLKEGEVFGELALLIDTTRTADVVAKTDIQLMRLPKSVFMKRFFENPKETFKLIKLMGKRTQDLLHRLEKSSNHD
jgi:CRP-like cAMP-binding protein